MWDSVSYISWFSDFASYLKTIWYINTILWGNESVWLDAWPHNESGSLRPIFHGSVILPYILKTFWNMIPWANESIWLDAWLQTKSGSLWPIFHGSVIIPSAYEVCPGVYSFRLSVRSSILPCIRASLWPLFHGPVILSYILKTVWCMKMILGIISQYSPTFNLIITVYLFDIYCMIQ